MTGGVDERNPAPIVVRSGIARPRRVPLGETSAFVQRARPIADSCNSSCGTDDQRSRRGVWPTKESQTPGRTCEGLTGRLGYATGWSEERPVWDVDLV